MSNVALLVVYLNPKTIVKLCPIGKGLQMAMEKPVNTCISCPSPIICSRLAIAITALGFSHSVSPTGSGCPIRSLHFRVRHFLPNEKKKKKKKLAKISKTTTFPFSTFLKNKTRHTKVTKRSTKGM